MRVFSIVLAALASAATAPVVATIIEPMQPDVWPGGRAVGIYVGTDCGLAMSRDSGATWTHVVPQYTQAAHFPQIVGVIW